MHKFSHPRLLSQILQSWHNVLNMLHVRYHGSRTYQPSTKAISSLRNYRTSLKLLVTLEHDLTTLEHDSTTLKHDSTTLEYDSMQGKSNMSF